jgi:hypothetical protein
VIYNGLTRTRFETAAAAGALSGPAVRRGAAGSRRQGTWVQFDVLPGQGGRHALVEAVRFQAFGCPHVIAVSDWIAECAVGRGLTAGLPAGIPALQQLFAVPVEKLGRLLVVEDAWIAATVPPCPG